MKKKIAKTIVKKAKEKAKEIMKERKAKIECKKIQDDARKNQKILKKEKEREERENLTLESLDATFSICKELTRCVRGEKPNGELTEAFEYMQDVKRRIAEYQRKRASRQ